MAVAQKIRSGSEQPQTNRVVVGVPRGRNLAAVLTNNVLAVNTLKKDESIAALNQRLDGRMKESYAP
jgi:hypothetical protein